MQVRIKVTGNIFGKFGRLMWMGQKTWVDEKEAALFVEAGVAEIIETQQAVFKPKLSKR